MSKSRGNVYTVRDALRTYSGAQLRVFLLSRHYRMDMDLRGIDSAAKPYSRLKRLTDKCRRAAGVASKDYDDEFLLRFSDAMNDDFDTPLALKVLSEGVASASNMR